MILKTENTINFFLGNEVLSIVILYVDYPFFQKLGVKLSLRYTEGSSGPDRSNV